MTNSITNAQPDVWDILKKIITNDKVGSAYLFSGPSGSGKEYMAIEFAAQINKNLSGISKESAENNYSAFKNLQHELLKLIFPLPSSGTKSNSSNPLDSLKESDLEILKNEILKKAQDPFHKIEIPSATRILIDSIRELRKTLYLKSDDAGRKIVIIFDSHLLGSGQAESANALLKILEEPPQNTTLILTTSSKQILPPTITSRCQQIEFAPLQKEFIVNDLVQRGIDHESAQVFAGLAQGDIHKARFLSNEPLEDLLKRINKLTEVIFEANSTEWRNFINTNAGLVRNDRSKYFFNLYLMQIWFNSAYRFKRGLTDELHHPVVIKKLDQFNKLYPNADLYKINLLIEEAIEAVGKNLNMSLTLTNLLISIHKNLK